MQINFESAPSENLNFYRKMYYNIKVIKAPTSIPLTSRKIRPFSDGT